MKSGSIPDSTVLEYVGYLRGAPRGGQTSAAVARASGRSHSWANRVLKVAHERGLVRRVGHRKQFILYGLTDRGMRLLLDGQPRRHDGAYPLLAELRRYREDAAESETRLGQYLAAAEAVRSFDPAMASELEGKAEALRAMSLSRVECEYLKYAEEHP